MTYEKHTFVDGDILYADDLNAMSEALANSIQYEGNSLELGYPIVPPVSSLTIAPPGVPAGASINYADNVDNPNPGQYGNDNEVFAVLEFWGCTGDQTTILRRLAPGQQFDDAVTVGQLNSVVGDIETALDNIIAMQNKMFGDDGIGDDDIGVDGIGDDGI